MGDTTTPEVGDYDPNTGRMTMRVRFGSISRRQRREALAAIRAAGLTIHGFPGFAPHDVLTTGTEAQYLAFDNAYVMITGASGDMPSVIWHVKNNYARRQQGT